MTPSSPLFPTAYFPSIALMAAMVKAPKIDIDIQESFPKQTHRNRTVIITANGPMTLSVPVVRPNGTHTLTRDILISYSEKWSTIHWRTIESAYNSSPYFLYYRDEIEKILMTKHDTLIQLNESLLQLLLRKLKIELTIEYTSDFVKPQNTANDFRDKYSYKRPESCPICPTYTQVFSDRIPFNPNVSIIDTLFNLGPETKEYLSKIQV